MNVIHPHPLSFQSIVQKATTSWDLMEELGGMKFRHFYHMADAIMFPSILNENMLDLPFKKVVITETMQANGVEIGSIGASNTTICEKLISGLPPCIAASFAISSATIWPTQPSGKCDYVTARYDVTISGGDNLASTQQTIRVDIGSSGTLPAFSTPFSPPSSGSTWDLRACIKGSSSWGDARPGQNVPAFVTTNLITMTLVYLTISI